ncbi:hypothetical protein DFH27DRAFT_530135 [Peziza echinospora]|nr:hypothetical protein DFH27DRAFT_530135 [Peziza echinospora]
MTRGRLGTRSLCVRTTIGHMVSLLFVSVLSTISVHSHHLGKTVILLRGRRRINAGLDQRLSPIRLASVKVSRFRLIITGICSNVGFLSGCRRCQSHALRYVTRL